MKIFYALIFARPQGRCLKPEPEAQQMLVHKKILFDRCYCIKTQYDVRKLKNF